VRRTAAAAQWTHRVFVAIAERVGGDAPASNNGAGVIAYENSVRSSVKDGPAMTCGATVSSKQAQARDKGTGWGMNVLTSFLVEWGIRDYFSIGES
jgi:hypothetical protein